MLEKEKVSRTKRQLSLQRQRNPWLSESRLRLGSYGSRNYRLMKLLTLRGSNFPAVAWACAFLTMLYFRRYFFVFFFFFPEHSYGIFLFIYLSCFKWGTGFFYLSSIYCSYSFLIVYRIKQLLHLQLRSSVYTLHKRECCQMAASRVRSRS